MLHGNISDMNDERGRDLVKLAVRNIPAQDMRGIAVLAAAKDLSRSAYIRWLIKQHVAENLPEDMKQRL